MNTPNSVKPRIVVRQSSNPHCAASVLLFTARCGTWIVLTMSEWRSPDVMKARLDTLLSHQYYETANKMRIVMQQMGI